ncbi:MAG: methyltransferase domain-containing protein [Ktedonobacteraceae bacterium]|nr:methyltransferase domain-containing protein [Ktedonobacteraceae bacterium]
MTSSVDEMAPVYARRLVATLKDAGYLTTPLLEEAFSSVPRHAFLDHFYIRDMAHSRLAWRLVQAPPVEEISTWLGAIYTSDSLITKLNGINIPISSSSEPGVMAIMLDALDVQRGMRVLEIGTGTGYNAALLAHMVGDPHLVFTVEIDPEMAQLAQQRLDQVVGTGTTVYAGNGLEGYPPGVPFDRIIATASHHTVPHAWLDQLRQEGVLVMPFTGNMGTGSLLQVKKEGMTRAVHGRFLRGLAFMHMRESIQESPPIIQRLLSQCLTHPVVATMPLVKTEFDLELLSNPDFTFVLQLEFPQVYFCSMQKPPSTSPTFCLVDAASQGMVAFCPTEQKDAWLVEVRGEPGMWEKIYHAYQRWLEFGRPHIGDYVIEIDEAGKQRVGLARPTASPLFTWELE